MATQDFPRMQVAAAVIIAAISVTAPGLQPMLLGALLAAGQIGAHTLGLAATVEALGAVILFFAGVMVFWVYAVPLGTQIGIPAHSMQLVLAISTGVQIVGGVAAIALSTKLTGFQVVVITSLAGAAAIVLTRGSPKRPVPGDAGDL